MCVVVPQQASMRVQRPACRDIIKTDSELQRGICAGVAWKTLPAHMQLEH